MGEPLLRKSLEILSAVEDTETPDYATGLNNLAALYESMVYRRGPASLSPGTGHPAHRVGRG